MPRLLKRTLHAGDLEPPIDFFVTDGNDEPVSLSGATATFRMARIDENGDLDDAFSASATIVAPESDGHLRYTWASGDTDEPGDYVSNFEISDGSRRYSVPNDGWIHITILPRITVVP